MTNQEKKLREEFDKFVKEKLPDRVGDTPKDVVADWWLQKRTAELEGLIEKIEKLAGQNTYEGDEALVYKTTMKEVLSILNK